jgi:hypothetical protein
VSCVREFGGAGGPSQAEVQRVVEAEVSEVDESAWLIYRYGGQTLLHRYGLEYSITRFAGPEAIIKFERLGDLRVLPRVAIDEKTVGEHLTAVQAKLLVNEILDWFVLTGKVES